MLQKERLAKSLKADLKGKEGQFQPERKRRPPRRRLEKRVANGTINDEKVFYYLKLNKDSMVKRKKKKKTAKKKATKKKKTKRKKRSRVIKKKTRKWILVKGVREYTRI